MSSSTDNAAAPFVVPPRGDKGIDERVQFLEEYYRSRCMTRVVSKEEKNSVVLEYALSIYLDFFRRYLSTRRLEAQRLTARTNNWIFNIITHTNSSPHEAAEEVCIFISYP